jgi:hypothetical protein
LKEEEVFAENKIGMNYGEIYGDWMVSEAKRWKA